MRIHQSIGALLGRSLRSIRVHNRSLRKAGRRTFPAVLWAFALWMAMGTVSFAGDATVSQATRQRAFDCVTTANSGGGTITFQIPSGRNDHHQLERFAEQRGELRQQRRGGHDQSGQQFAESVVRGNGQPWIGYHVARHPKRRHQYHRNGRSAAWPERFRRPAPRHLRTFRNISAGNPAALHSPMDFREASARRRLLRCLWDL